jgi:triacylglycerol esterase/lipase EstA (alpha/beta hydrolase family)
MWSSLSLAATTLAGVGIYVALAVRFAHGRALVAWIAAIPLVYLAAVLVLCAIYFAIAWIFRARRPAAMRLGPRRTLTLVVREYLALAGAMPRLVFYRRLVRDPSPAPIATPILLVHGVLCNAGVWTRFARFLRREGIDGVYSLSYGPPLASIESFAEQLAAKIDEVLAATGARGVAIVAHSMGGLVTRAYLRAHGCAKIARVLTLGAPHHGSVFAWLFPGVSLAQMRPGNAWLAKLNDERLDPSLRFVSLWSWHDSMVAPQTSSELPGTVDVALVGVGHNALLADPDVFAFALGEIRAARAAGTARTPAREALPAGVDQGQAG